MPKIDGGHEQGAKDPAVDVSPYEESDDVVGRKRITLRDEGTLHEALRPSDWPTCMFRISLLGVSKIVPQVCRNY
ncbi:hypothetical protein AMTR_s00165p00052980 [Amborella trichopoda]|uniref:Uncharacterized protein n=1 Tax=Amborella trichopoda TaxID=13333 RepID=W1PX77_AMBTC|nr:hypothetical protein AMTR_s00165p00052980 [Amborella trichopoda]